LPFDLAQGGESFDSAQDREPVERLVEPFEICFLVLGILMIFIRKKLYLFQKNNCLNDVALSSFIVWRTGIEHFQNS
jgi:hypothetical protein